MKLYEIHDQIEKILNECVDHETGEITPEAALQLDNLELQRDQVGLYLARAYKGEITEAEACRGYVKPILERAEEHRRRAASHERRAAWLKDYLEKFIPEGDKLKDETVSLFWSSSASVVTVEEATNMQGEPIFEAIDQRYVRVERSIDKALAKPMLAAGLKISGLTLRNAKHLVIK